MTYGKEVGAGEAETNEGKGSGEDDGGHYG